MHPNLYEILKANIGQPLSPDLAADILLAADKVPTLIPHNVIERIKPMQCGEYTFSVEKMCDIVDSMRHLHRAHWAETECHRHDLILNPDYDTFIRYERAGRYILFTLRKNAELMGNCAMYLDMSAHTKTLIATEDTLYLLPEARRGRVASSFIAYCEAALKQIGIREICVTVKTVNKAGRFFRMLGYSHVENGLTKVLED
jgi:N-acetylglutamate synthase-like GNAT family acetyltransferase